MGVGNGDDVPYVNAASALLLLLLTRCDAGFDYAAVRDGGNSAAAAVCQRMHERMWFSNSCSVI